ncbi:MAG TPA: heavy metal-binding domain-containing protein [Solirubrobacteraceae bacterium]|nr:heavy metal-binding domain-containing protein [Solirubrobacteraceae bacterium]
MDAHTADPEGQQPPESPAEEREQERSLERIEQGGIPLAAERRLQATGAGALPFSSTLSVGEFALSSKLGLRPVGQVLGASVHQVGYQYLPPESSWGGQVMCELDVVSQAWEETRRRALNRLTEEARQAGADAVVGVSVKSDAHDWAEGAIDYMVSGTAVRLPESRGAVGSGQTVQRLSPRGAGHPILSDLSGQEYWQLYQAGYMPAGLVMATAAVFVSPSSGMQMQRWITAYQNQELTEFTQGFYTAREIVLDKLSTQAAANRADGIVGVRIDQHAGMESFRVGGYGSYGSFGGAGSNQERHGLLITLHAMGTAIRCQENLPVFPPEPAVDLTT